MERQRDTLGNSQGVGTIKGHGATLTPDKLLTLEAAGGMQSPSQILAITTAAKHPHQGLQVEPTATRKVGDGP